MKINSKSIFSIVFLFFLIKLNAQVINDSIMIDGHYRTFHFNLPLKNSTNASLIFVLHGSGGNGLKSMKGTSKLLDIANKENLLVLFPDGYLKNWNECRKNAPALANIENIDENTFFSKMIDYCATKYFINRQKVFAIGTSGGGHMVYKLAMTIPEKFKAITAIVANLPDASNIDCVEKKIPIAVMVINGTNDLTNPYNGGISAKNKGLVISTDATFQYWATINGYEGEATKEELPDLQPDGKTIEKYTYKQGGKPEVVLLKVINGEHNNPKDIDIFLESWIFFKRQ
ncbi:MAG: poly(3-hydroxybutyrate) depolymerase [Flavobacteriaceae bacterium]|nr:poly(3-hydroxybutyrate) depolymerase [Flavobacteriaceae bacterium]